MTNPTPHRAVSILVLALGLAGCQVLLGIDDPVGDECSPFDVSTCDLSDTCDFDPDLGYLTCRTEGTVLAGQLCFEFDDCRGPLTCFAGVCRTFCPVFGEACTDAAEAECLIQLGSSQVCDNDCDVVAGEGCDAVGTECILANNDNGSPVAMCVPLNYFGGVPAGGDCFSLADCTAGYACDDPEGDGGLCGKLCDADVPETCVSDGSACVSRFETLHGRQVGICPQ